MTLFEETSLNLYDHQKTAIEQMHNGCILNGGVGSGKSRASLAYFFTKVCNGEYKPIKIPTRKLDLYIITTARKRDTFEWDQECAAFLISQHKEINYSGIKLTIDSWNNIGKYTNVMNSFFIFDEQRVVGSGAWVKSFLRITKLNKWILLSATPGDTWLDYIPVFIANGFYRNRTEFIRRHVVFSRFSKYPKVERYLEVARLEKLREMVLVDMDFLKPTVQHHKIIEVPYNRKLYVDANKNRWDIFKNEPLQNASALCYMLRRIVNSDEQRIEAVKNIILMHPRVIIFYNFDYELELLRKMSKEIGITLAEWNGHKHEPVPKSNCWVYLVQYAAGAEGWNCVTTNTIIFYSQNYSYKITEQASGRIDRLNTPYLDLYYYHIKSNSSIDNGIYRALQMKKTFNEKRFSEKMAFA